MKVAAGIILSRLHLPPASAVNETKQLAAGIAFL